MDREKRIPFHFLPTPCPVTVLSLNEPLERLFELAFPLRVCQVRQRIERLVKRRISPSDEVRKDGRWWSAVTDARTHPAAVCPKGASPFPGSLSATGACRPPEAIVAGHKVLPGFCLNEKLETGHDAVSFVFPLFHAYNYTNNWPTGNMKQIGNTDQGKTHHPCGPKNDRGISGGI